MYSQYNYYQSNSNSQQPQPQQQQTTSTANQVWNGQQWVSTTDQQQQQSYAQAATQPQQGGAAIGQGVGSGGGQGMIIKHGKTHAELVQHYTSCKFYVCMYWLDVSLRVCAYLVCVHIYFEFSYCLPIPYPVFTQNTN